MFNVRALRDAEEQERRWLTDVFGIHWDSEKIHRLAGTIKSDEDSKGRSKAWHEGFILPHSVLVASSNFVKELAKIVPPPGAEAAVMPVAMGDYVPGTDEEIVSLSATDKADFFKALSNAGIYGGPVTPRAPDGQIKEGKVARGEHFTPSDKTEFKKQMKTAVPGYQAEIDPDSVKDSDG